MTETSKPVLPRESGTPVGDLITENMLRHYAYECDHLAEQGYGIDGMPLQRGQSPLSRPRAREPKNQGGGGSGDMTLEERRASAISGRTWQAWDGQTQGTRAEPSRADASEKARLLREMADLKVTNAKLGEALRNLKADKETLRAENEKLRALCGAVLETAYGADWAEQLKGVENGCGQRT